MIAADGWIRVKLSDMTPFSASLKDIVAGLRMRRVWLALAAEDIGDQHRRTALGPVWLLVNYLLFATTFIVIFGGWTSVDNFPAYLATGLLVWLYLSEAVTQSITVFSREESFIKGTVLPMSVYVLRLTAQSMLRGAYALVGCVAILVISGTPVTIGALWSFLGVGLVVLCTPAIAMTFGVIGAFFPDLQFIVSNIMRLGMFLTPIFWSVDQAGGARALLYTWNPATYFIEIVRTPILEGELPVVALCICLAICAAIWSIGLYLFGRYRRQLVFVL